MKQLALATLRGEGRIALVSLGDERIGAAREVAGPR